MNLLNSIITSKSTFLSFKYRISPTEDQKILLSKHFGCSRFIYNHFLKEKQNHYLNNGKTLNYNQCCDVLVLLKKSENTNWLKEVNSQILQQSLKNLETAYGQFFKKQSRFPNFKKKSKNQSFRVPQHISIDNNKVYFPKFNEGIDVIFHRPVLGTIKSCTFTKTPTNKYFVSFLCEVSTRDIEKTGLSVGVDLGIKDFIVLSNCEKVKNPHFNRKYKKELAHQQKHLSRKVEGSRNRNKQRTKVVKIHEKITNSRKDFHHKLSTELINKYDILCLETLAVKNMVKNRKLAYSVSDSGWSSFVIMLEYKASIYGKIISKIDRFYPSSKTCSNCDYTADKLGLNIRKWNCPSCNMPHDRDINAAKNILRQGLNNVNSLEQCLTDMEGLALASSDRDETDPYEILKKRNYISKPLSFLKGSSQNK